MAEHLTVAQVVEGSIPFAHPNSVLIRSFKLLRCKYDYSKIC